MIKFLFFISFSFQCLAWSNPDGFKSSYIELEESILSATIKGYYKDAKASIDDNVKRNIINDTESKVSKNFVIPKYFKHSVNFWFSIYTQYSSDQVVLHDSESLQLVYNVIDFSELKNNKSIHRFAKAKLQAQLSLEYTRRIKKLLKRLSTKSLNKLNEEESTVLSDIKKAGFKIPKRGKRRKRFFKNLSLNLRTQTGQRDIIHNGLMRVNPYMSFLKKQIKNFNLPQELIAISFLESSFNTKAMSKANAAGAWQFMPYISNLFMPRINKYQDYRLNPVISSISAFHLLKENKTILKRWDLAIPAYNSGPKHLKKAIKILSKKRKKKDIGLDYILQNYKHPHIGFASKNFYAEFLALTRVLAYKEIIYPLKGINKKSSIENINIYVSKCKINPNKYFKLLKRTSPHIKDLNSHFKRPKSTLKRGTLIVSDRDLTKRKYYKLSDKELKKRFPKNYYKYISKQKCR